MSNRKFQNTVKPFFTSKGILHNDNISIDITGNIAEDEQKKLTNLTCIIQTQQKQLLVNPQ